MINTDASGQGSVRYGKTRYLTQEIILRKFMPLSASCPLKNGIYCWCIRYDVWMTDHSLSITTPPSSNNSEAAKTRPWLGRCLPRLPVVCW
jgi:hypothetical protein